MKKIKNKKSLIRITALVIIALIGLTYAFYSNSTTFDNLFKTSGYSTTATEKFESPDDWKPGDTTEKTITVKNNEDVDVAVRVCVDSNNGTWTSKNGDTWANTKDNAALINESSSVTTCDTTNANWKKVTNDDGGYCYYYTKKLSNDETTANSPIESVTYNKDVVVDDNCTTTTENGQTSVTCSSSGDGYDDATYTLPIKVETIQLDAMEDEWGISLDKLNECTGYKVTYTYYTYLSEDELSNYDSYELDEDYGTGIYKYNDEEIKVNRYLVTKTDGIYTPGTSVEVKAQPNIYYDCDGKWDDGVDGVYTNTCTSEITKKVDDDYYTWAWYYETDYTDLNAKSIKGSYNEGSFDPFGKNNTNHMSMYYKVIDDSWNYTDETNTFTMLNHDISLFSYDNATTFQIA